jgi:WD40 repeat protein
MRKSSSTSFWKRPDPVKKIPFLALLAAALFYAAPQDRTLVTDAPVDSFVFMPDGKTLVASWDKHLRTWETGSGKAINDRTLEPGVFLVHANMLVETGEKGFQIWDLSADRHSKMINGTLEPRERGCFFRPQTDGRRLGKGTQRAPVGSGDR